MPILCAALFGAVLHVGMAAADPVETPSDAQDLGFWEELAFWDAIKDSKNPQEYRAYLNAYPQGRFAALARLRIKALGGSGKPSGPEPVGRNTAREQTAPHDGEHPRKIIRDCDGCPQLAIIPPGRFRMGSARGRREEQPVHTVELSQPFAMGIYEITAGEWDVCVREGGCKYNPARQEGPSMPISNVSWEDAQRYVQWLSKKTKKEYRLPSEAEWEYAARAGTTTDYWWGNSVKPGMANCTDCQNPGDGKGKVAVGSFKPNPFGLYDVHGNVWEWTADCWNPSYKGAPSDGQPWVRGECLSRILRGGSWNLDSDYMRASRRGRYDLDVRYYLNGFRVARSME
jgi:formylglycine-generating enzyme required for sulfatase activity